MQVTVYLDLIFLINFCVGCYILFITGWLMKVRINMLRIGLGALFESIVFLPLIMYPRMLMGYTGVILSIVISMGAVFISLGGDGDFMKKWFLSTTITVIFGGIFQLLKNVLFSQTVTLYIWTLIFLLSSLLMFIILRNIMKIRNERNNVFHVIISCRQKSIECNVFLDTGNRLKDNLFGKPVMLLSEEIMEKVLSDKEIDFINEYKKKGYIDYQNPIVLSSQKNICFHEIAYKSVGRSSGKLLCILIDMVEIVNGDKTLRKQPAAIVDDFLFRNKDYKGLLFDDDI